MDSCFALIGAHKRGIAVDSSTGKDQGRRGGKGGGGRARRREEKIFFVFFPPLPLLYFTPINLSLYQFLTHPNSVVVLTSKMAGKRHFWKKKSWIALQNTPALQATQAARASHAHAHGRPVLLSVFSLAHDLSFDCSRVREYSKIRIVLQSKNSQFKLWLRMWWDLVRALVWVTVWPLEKTSKRPKHEESKARIKI